VRVAYAGQCHVDLVPCIEAAGVTQICNRETNQFEASDGTGYRDWLNAKNQVTNGELKRVTKLLKHLRDRKGTFTAKSILLTTLLGNAVNDWDSATDYPDTPTALVLISDRVNQFLQGNPTMPEVANPALLTETFDRHWDNKKYQNFRDKFNDYTQKIQDAYNEPDRNESIRKWRLVFDKEFAPQSVQASTIRPRVSGFAPARPHASTK